MGSANNWLTSNDGLSAIHWNNNIATCTLVNKGENYVMADFQGTRIVSYYYSPNKNTRDFEDSLDQLQDILNKQQGASIILAGDFNARSSIWGDRITNVRGKILANWIEYLDLRLVNRGTKPTYSAPQGDSIIDLIWVTSGILKNISDWHVDADFETLSDHRVIKFMLNNGKNSGVIKKKNPFIKWSMKKFNQELFVSSLEWSCEIEMDIKNYSAEQIQKVINKALKKSMDISAPRTRHVSSRKQAYWWSKTIEETRKKAIKFRRALTKIRKKDPSDSRIKAEQDYKVARSQLKMEIASAKIRAWRELIMTINKDPWGMPYRIVMKKLKTNSGLTESMSKQQLINELETLFSRRRDYTKEPTPIQIVWNEEWNIGYRELVQTLKQNNNNRAPGLDGIPGAALKKSPEKFLRRFLSCYNACLRDGKFPRDWKKKRVVLIPKDKNSVARVGQPIKSRPICLISDLAKTFERIINNRITDWLSENSEFEFSDNQFGFRRGKSTTDALLKLRTIVDPIISSGGIAVVVSLDICNAFNSLPWSAIRIATRNKGLPGYLIRIIDDYLRNRKIVFADSRGKVNEMEMQAGVPQGFVLVPLLWNITYDKVLEEEMEEGCTLLCFADDTLIITQSNNISEGIHKTNIQISRTLRQIRKLGLKVAAHKTGAMIFSKKHKIKDMYIRVDDA